MAVELKREEIMSKKRLSSPDNQRQDWASLWVLTCKLRGLGELLQVVNPEEMAISQDGFHGIGAFVLEIANEVDGIRVNLETN
jgi:hypothetical protein